MMIIEDPPEKEKRESREGKGPTGEIGMREEKGMIGEKEEKGVKGEKEREVKEVLVVAGVIHLRIITTRIITITLIIRADLRILI